MLLVAAGLDGAQAYALAVGARTVGSDTFVLAQVVAGQLSRQEVVDRLRRNPAIRRSDARYLERVAGHTVIVAPTTQRSADISAGGRRYEGASVNGTTADLARIRDLDVGEGRFFVPVEDQQAAQVAVIGAEVATALFPASDPLGRSVRIAGRGFRVIGLVRPQGTGGGLRDAASLLADEFVLIYGDSYLPIDYHAVGIVRRTDYPAIGIKRQLRPNNSPPHHLAKTGTKQLRTVHTTFGRSWTVEQNTPDQSTEREDAS